MTKPTIAFITHLPNLSGANQSLIELAKGLVATGQYSPLVYLGKPGILAQKLDDAGIDYKIIPYKNDIKGNNSYIRTQLKAFWNIRAVKQLAKDFVNENVALVHNNSYLVSIGMQAAKKAGIPYISHLRDFVWEDHGIILERPEKSRQLMDKADAVVAVSHAVAAKYQPTIPHPIQVIYDGVDKSDYDINLAARPAFKANENEVQLYIAGRIHPGKGQLEAIKAVEILNQNRPEKIRLIIIGHPTDRSYAEGLTDYVSERNLDNIEILDYVDDLRKLREQSDIGLVCSKLEAMGRVTVENMYSGCLTIGANSGGTAELIGKNQYGLLYEVGNPSDLADQISYALDHKSDMQQTIVRAKTFVEETFDNQIYSQKIQELYQKILQKGMTK